MRRRCLLFSPPSLPPQQFSLREWFAGSLFVSILLATCAYIFHRWENPWSWPNATFEVLMLFIPALNLILAAILTVFVNGLSTCFAKPGLPSRQIAHATRKYWYWSARAERYPELLPILLAAAHIVFYMCWWFMAIMAYRDPFRFLLEAIDAPVSIAEMFQLTNLAFLGYFAAHLFRGLLPATAAPSSERFALIYASILIVTSWFTVP